MSKSGEPRLATNLRTCWQHLKSGKDGVDLHVKQYSLILKYSNNPLPPACPTIQFISDTIILELASNPTSYRAQPTRLPPPVSGPRAPVPLADQLETGVSTSPSSGYKIC